MRYSAFVLVCLLGVGVPGDARADSAYVDEVLRALEQKGLLSAQEVHDIKLRARQHAPQLQRVPPAQTSAGQTAAPPGASRSATPAVALWGRLQPRLTYIPDQNGRDGTTAFTFRRARIGARGTMAPDVSYFIQYEAANELPGLANAQNLLDAWIRFGVFGDSVGDVIVGQQFMPGYGRAPQLTASVERKFPEYLSPGYAGLGRGLTVRRGRFGLPETPTDGLLGDRLQFGLGVFNSPDLALNNDNDDLLYAAAVGLTPRGATSGDEYSAHPLPTRYMVAASFAQSRDRGGLEAEFQEGVLGRDVTLNQKWYGAFADFQSGFWYAWASVSLFDSAADGAHLLSADGTVRRRLRSHAWALGLSRTFALRAAGQRLGLAAQLQGVDNRHPTRTRFFRTLTGSSPQEIGRGMDEGLNYQLMVTWLLSAHMRWINEFAWYDAVADAGYGAWVSQFQIDF